MIQSYLLITNNTEQINILKSKYKITPLNLFEFTPLASIGIDLVRKIKSLLSNKNTSGLRLIIVYKFETATDEAQNAFLKLLEEPPLDTIILLVAQNSQKILPTIYSRCQLVKTPASSLSESENKESLSILIEILNSTPGKRLQIAGQYNKNKNDALNFLKNQILALKQAILSPPDHLTARQISEIISKIESAKGFLDANVSSKGVMDVLFLGLSRL